MNFLAHALLAGDADADRIGGLMGDFIKGPLPGNLPPDLASGAALHRAIDSFADRHTAFSRSRQRISASRRRLSGVLVDLFYDHLLARDWAHHSAIPLAEYTHGLYASLEHFREALPASATDIADRMRTQDWLTSYRNLDAVGHVIDRMSIYRLRGPNALTGGIEEFIADAAGFEADFREFFPDALAFAAHWRDQRTTASLIANPGL